MSDEKQNQGNKFSLKDDKNPMASRARNRTVMLSPQVTDRVRELLSHESGVPDPVNQIIQPKDLDTRSSVSQATVVENTEPSVDQLAGKPYRSKRVSEVLGQSLNIGVGEIQEVSSRSAAIALGAGLPTEVVTNSSSRLVTKNKKTKLVGFLVSFEKEVEGEVIELRVGRWLLTSKPTEHGDFILIDDPSVSPLHAIVRITKEGKVQILDQLSENGTSITRANSTTAEDVSGTMVDVQHGDKIHFGKRSFFVCLLPPEV